MTVHFGHPTDLHAWVLHTGFKVVHAFRLPPLLRKSQSNASKVCIILQGLLQGVTEAKPASMHRLADVQPHNVASTQEPEENLLS